MKELVFPREFERAARRSSDSPAIIDLGHNFQSTFDGHLERVRRLSGAMRGRLGLRTEDRFAAIMGNRHEFVELWHAGLCGAALFNPVNARLAAEELRFILKDSGTAVIFLDAGYAEVIDEVRGDLPDLRFVVLAGEDQGAPHDLLYEDLLANAVPEMPDEPEEDDRCVLMYTGGTTGRPKGVVLTQRNVMLNWHRCNEAIRPAAGWTMLQVVPMFHVGSMLSLMVAHLAGGAMVLLPTWNPSEALDAIETHGLTAMGAVPTMYAQLLAEPDFRPERVATIRYVGYGASPMPLGLLREIIEVFPADAAICQSYGMTEAVGMVSFLDNSDHRCLDPDVLRSVGRPMSGSTWTIQDSDGAVLPAGEIGEICIRSGSIMEGYWNRPEETADALRGGWYHSGDAGYENSEGYLWVTDRLKDMIVSGGENIYSIEVESAISTHPAVARVAVVGLPHPIWGEAVHAVVALKPGMMVDGEALRVHVRQQLAGYKVPKTIEFTDEEFPMSAAGKVLKHKMRDDRARSSFENA